MSDLWAHIELWCESFCVIDIGPESLRHGENECRGQFLVLPNTCVLGRTRNGSVEILIFDMQDLKCSNTSTTDRVMKASFCPVTFHSPCMSGGFSYPQCSVRMEQIDWGRPDREASSSRPSVCCGRCQSCLPLLFVRLLHPGVPWFLHIVLPLTISHRWLIRFCCWGIQSKADLHIKLLVRIDISMEWPPHVWAKRMCSPTYWTPSLSYHCCPALGAVVTGGSVLLWEIQGFH